MVTNDQTNMPAFQRYWPLLTYSSALSKCGFSTNCSALKKAVLWSWPLRRRQFLADPNVPVARGRLGRLDANGDDGLAARRQIKRVRQHLLKLLLVGDDVVGRQHRHDAGGGTRPTSAAPSVTAAVVSRPMGSATRFSFGIFGSCLRTSGSLRLVGDDENVLGGTSGSTRSTACCRNERLPSSVSSCLGIFSRLTGQNRSPRPPAMIMTNRSLVFDFAFMAFSATDFHR